MRKLYILFSLLPAFVVFAPAFVTAQPQSIARIWNELQLTAIRNDFARPPVHARSLHHVSIAMYDAWAAYDTTAETYLLGKTIGNFNAPFLGVPTPPDIEAARQKAISYAAYRLLYFRFQNSPGAFISLSNFNLFMIEFGYDINNTSIDYASGDPAALGNYIALQVILYGLQDGSNEANNYLATFYQPVNPPLIPSNANGNPSVLDINRWQPLLLANAIDQNGNPIPALQVFQSPEWGRVMPFALSPADCDTFYRNDNEYLVYHNPGPPAMLDTAALGDPSEEFKWNHELVGIWSSHLDPADGVMWDISPATIGNLGVDLPANLNEYQAFYAEDGHVPHQGRAVNPYNGLPYVPQIVPRGDYTRVLAQFWADGPNSETPPGHWYSILNHAMDHPAFIKKFNGKGPELGNLEWDVKAYFVLGAALHDAAISAWGIKGWYDSSRPIAALRYMAAKGQCSDPDLPHYHREGVHLIPGLFELILPGDTLAGDNNQHLYKIKVNSWRAFDQIANPNTDFAGVGWELLENWWPYQRSTFVTPPFAGFISGHSTYSRAAAEALTLVTGDEYFPGGLAEYHIAANSGFLFLEQGPSVDITLQWATYRDASDQTSLSRIWGGIHPPMDDVPGRIIGAKAGIGAFEKAVGYFYKDEDGDGVYSYEDCDDHNAAFNPLAIEICDGMDNNCNGLIDDGLTFYTFYVDQDGDGYGVSDTTTNYLSCIDVAPVGYVWNASDCNDANADIHPDATEICDGIDNNCNQQFDEDLPQFTYYFDGDGDGFGTEANPFTGCSPLPPAGYVLTSTDCDDANAAMNPDSTEIIDGFDNDCNGLIDDVSGVSEAAFFVAIYPNPVADWLTLQSGRRLPARYCVIDAQGKKWLDDQFNAGEKTQRISCSNLPPGVYTLWIMGDTGENPVHLRFVKM